MIVPRGGLPQVTSHAHLCKTLSNHIPLSVSPASCTLSSYLTQEASVHQLARNRAYNCAHLNHLCVSGCRFHKGKKSRKAGSVLGSMSRDNQARVFIRHIARPVKVLLAFFPLFSEPTPPQHKLASG